MKIINLNLSREEQVKKLIEAAKAQLGKPYKWGHNINWSEEKEPEAFDCSLFIQWCFKKIGIWFDEERSTILQAEASGQEVKRIEDLIPGDLVFFKGTKGYYDFYDKNKVFGGREIFIGHVGIYCGDGKIIHAKGGTGVIEEDLLTSAADKTITFMKRYF
ncbi:MAG: C40 family peptidase [Candidatus Paceibacterota bacterium]|jgi:cell wall-associated NlpC family hydrolase